jgi:hypothetical protein
MVLANGIYSGAVFVEYVLRENADALTEQQLNDIAGEIFETSYEGLVAVYSVDMRGLKIVLPHTNTAESAVDVGIAIGEFTSAVEGNKLLDYWIKETGHEKFDASLKYFDTTIC